MYRNLTKEIFSVLQITLFPHAAEFKLNSVSFVLPKDTGEQGWRSGESTRLPPMWPGFESWRRRHMWVEFVVGSLPCSERFFSECSGFPLSLKNQHFQIPIRSGTHGHVSTSSYELLSAPWVNKLQFTIYNLQFLPVLPASSDNYFCA